MKQYDPKLMGIVAQMVKSEHDGADRKHEAMQDIAARYAAVKDKKSGVEGHNTRKAREEQEAKNKGFFGKIASYFP